MSREVRKVPAEWVHPKNERGNYKPLFEGYASDSEEFMSIAQKDGLQSAVEFMGSVDKDNYMPDWNDEEATHLMMNETTSEGTPISPAFETPEALAIWLVDNNASAFGGCGASYDGWLLVANGCYAPSCVFTGGAVVSGVDAL